MASARVTWIGWSEFEDALRKLPLRLTTQAQGIVLAAANETATEVRTAYPVRTTNLNSKKLGPPGGMRRGVKVEPGHANPFAAYVCYVRSTAPHAHLWEQGTKVRETKRTHANRGFVGEHLQQGLVATADRHARTMQAALAALVRAEGLEVTGAFGLD
jgi:hypothetical protein